MLIYKNMSIILHCSPMMGAVIIVLLFNPIELNIN